MNRLGFVILCAAGCGTPMSTAPDLAMGGGNNDLANDLAMSADPCPRTGIVPADLRDVERAGEGLVSTTFGSYPMRKPDWSRARIIHTVLKQVWGNLKVACPALPSPAFMQTEKAISDLDSAIAAMDPQKAAFAANSVGLACPDLFDYFHPDAPKQVIRMDAVYRQVGLDAHWNKLAEAAADVASLKSDWMAAKGAVATRAPMCHRVGGTATVSGDIDASLANLDAAQLKMDTMTMEKESENGALEIDTLELLFDCPPDNVTPMHGLGAKCAKANECDPGQVCDLMNAGGKCAPDPVQAKIGIKCMTTVDCGTDPRSACNTAAGDLYPGGYCFMEPCNDIEVCPPGATCVALGGEASGCFQTCVKDSDCRTGEGYVCQLFLTTPPKGFGPSDHACAFPCTRDADCQPPLKCNAMVGKCTP